MTQTGQHDPCTNSGTGCLRSVYDLFPLLGLVAGSETMPSPQPAPFSGLVPAEGKLWLVALRNFDSGCS